MSFTSPTSRDEFEQLQPQRYLDSPVQLESGIAIHDRDLRCIAWSRLCEELSALTKGSVLHSHSTLDTPLLQALGGKRALESALYGGSITLPDTLIVPPGQMPRWIACTHTALYGVAGEVIGVITQLADVSMQKSALSQMQGMLDEYQDLYHNSPAGHHSVDANGVFSQMNNTELRWLGYRREELVGYRRVADILTVESARRFEQNFQTLRKVGSVDEVEYDFVRKDGTTFPVLLSAKAKYGVNGEFIGERETAIDISDHRRTQEALAKSEANLQRAQTLARAGNYRFGTVPGEDNLSFQWSPELYRILGRDPKEGPISTEEYAHKVVHPGDSERLRQTTLSAVKNSTGFELEYRIIRPDGSVRHVRDFAELEPRSDEQTGCFFGVIQDVTELREAEANVTKREHLLATVVENSHEAVALFQADGRLIYISPGVTRIIGFSADEVIGKSISHRRHPDDIPRFLKWSVKLLRNPGSTATDEFRFRAKNGEWLWLEVFNSNQLHNEAVGAIVCNFRDVTQYKLREAELLAANERLLELSRHLRTSREQERARIARELHDELGSTLSAIKMYLGKPHTNADTPEDSAHIRAMELLDSASQSVAHIVTNLRPSVLDHRGLWPAVQWLATEFEDRTGVVCNFSIASTANDVDLSEDQTIALFRICQEALNNIARHADASTAAITVNCGGDALVIEIADDGTGMPPDQTAKHLTWGIVGIGERVTELGGTFDIRSAPNAGTVLAIRIPWRQANRGAASGITSS